MTENDVSIFSKLSNRGLDYLLKILSEDEISGVLSVIRDIVFGKKVSFKDNLYDVDDSLINDLKLFYRAYRGFPDIVNEAVKNSDSDLDEIYFSAFRLKVEYYFRRKPLKFSPNLYLMSLLRFSLKNKRYLRLFRKTLKKINYPILEALYDSLLNLRKLGYNEKFLVISNKEILRALDSISKALDHKKAKSQSRTLRSLLKIWSLNGEVEVQKSRRKIDLITAEQVINVLKPLRKGKPIDIHYFLKNHLEEELKKLEEF